MTSRAKPSASCGDSMAWPPYLMTKVFPQNARMYGSASMRVPAFSISFSMALFIAVSRRPGSEDVATQVVVPDGIRQPSLHELRVDGDGLPRQVRSLEGHLLQDPLQDGVQTACADVLGAVVHPRRNIRHRLDGVRGHVERHPLGLEEGRVLLDERALRLGQDSHEVAT